MEVDVEVELDDVVVVVVLLCSLVDVSKSGIFKDTDAKMLHRHKLRRDIS